MIFSPVLFIIMRSIQLAVWSRFFLCLFIFFKAITTKNGAALSGGKKTEINANQSYLNGHLLT